MIFAGDALSDTPARPPPRSADPTPPASQGTTEKLSYSSIFNPLIRRSTLYCNPVLLLGSISSAPRSVLAHYFGLKYNTGCVLRTCRLSIPTILIVLISVRSG